MKEITLFCGRVTLVSDEDYDMLLEYRWRADTHNASGQPYVKASAGRTSIYMHRLITKAPKTLKVDHWNKDTLDNQRHNLRVCTFHQNNANRQGFGLTGFKGVTISGNLNRKYRARFTHLEKTYSLGQFATAEEAARAYDRAAYEALGEYAYLNFPGEWARTEPQPPLKVPFFDDEEIAA